MIFPSGYGVSGRYILRKYSKGGILLGEWDFDNLITDHGMDNFADYNEAADNWTKYVILGAGSADPDVTNPNIDAYLTYRAYSTKDQWIDGVENDYRVIARTRYTFPPGTLDNVNITEIGVSALTNGTGLNSHAKIEDDQGNPTTITVLVDESLMVEYHLYTTILVDDVVSSFILDNEGIDVTINTTSRPACVTYLAGSNTYFCRGWYAPGVELFQANNLSISVNRPPVMSNATGLEPITSCSSVLTNGDTASSFVRDPYIAGSFERTGHCVWDGSVGPATWDTMTVFTRWGSKQFLFDPVIEKVIGKNLRMDFRAYWARV